LKKLKQLGAEGTKKRQPVTDSALITFLNSQLDSKHLTLFKLHYAHGLLYRVFSAGTSQF
jgi:hypothetical protein